MIPKVRFFILSLFSTLLLGCGSDPFPGPDVDLETICATLQSGVSYQGARSLYRTPEGFGHSGFSFKNGQYQRLLSSESGILSESSGEYECVNGGVMIDVSYDNSGEDTRAVDFNDDLTAISFFTFSKEDSYPLSKGTDVEACSAVRNQVFTGLDEESDAYINFVSINDDRVVIEYSWDGEQSNLALYDCDMGGLHLHPIVDAVAWEEYKDKETFWGFIVVSDYFPFTEQAIYLNLATDVITVNIDGSDLVLYKENLKI